MDLAHLAISVGVFLEDRFTIAIDVSIDRKGTEFTR